MHRILALVLLAACSAPTTRVPVFVDGRAVAASGDTLLGLARAGGLITFLPGRLADTLAADTLHDPVTVQWAAGRWWVSDQRAGRPAVVQVAPRGSAATIDLGDLTAQPHQFAVLPDGAIVVEAPDQRLVVWRGDSAATFAAVEVGPRPSHLVGAGGGVLHAVPDRHITLYNGFGHVRWRIEWPWLSTAHLGAIAVDRAQRIHILSGVADQGTFIVYSMEPSSGEIVRWSRPDSSGTFVVDRLGAVTPSTARP